MAVRLPPPMIERDGVSRIDVDLLQEVVRGQRTDIPKAQAITLLGASDHPGRHRDLEAVLRNEDDAPEFRHLAAWELAKLRSPEAVGSLVEAAAEVRDQGVLANIFRGLGQMGGPEVLEAIRGARRRARGVAAEQGRFAAALISYRHGLPGNDLTMPQDGELMPLSRGAARPVRIERARQEEIVTALRSIGEQPLQADLSNRIAHRLQCADLDWVVLLNRKLESRDGLERIRESKMLGGVVARLNKAKQSYSTSMLMLFSPVGRSRSVRMFFYRPVGTPFFVGNIEIGDRRAEFSVRSVKGAGIFPVKVEGTFDDRGLRFTSAEAALFSKEKRIPGRDPESSAGQA